MKQRIEKVIVLCALMIWATALLGQRVEMLTGKVNNIEVTKRVECIDCEFLTTDQQMHLMEVTLNELQFASKADEAKYLFYIHTLVEIRGTTFERFLDDTNFWLRENYLR